jgi:hypothetical protein
LRDARSRPGVRRQRWRTRRSPQVTSLDLGCSSCVSLGREPALRRIAHVSRRGVRLMRLRPLGVLARAGPRDWPRDPQAPASSPRYADSNEPRFRCPWTVEVAGSPGNSVPVAHRTTAPNAGRRGDATVRRTASPRPAGQADDDPWVMTARLAGAAHSEVLAARVTPRCSAIRRHTNSTD